ncbi:MAG: M28 family peptidase [Ilumatobacteraceae bacterium]
MRPSRLAQYIGMVLALLTATSCSSDDEPTSTSATTTIAVVTSAPATTAAGTVAVTTAIPDTTVTADSAAIAGYRTVVETLASDDLAGRDNLSDGSIAAQEFLIAQLSEFAQPAVAGATGPDAYRQAFGAGTNLIGVIPGTDLADQYVIVGAHYDHLGSDCSLSTSEPDDTICNGATDNATGVAAALAVGRSIAVGSAPRRSVIIALWDAEEDGLLGSAAYAANPIVPLAQTIAYLNFDIQGTDISPSLKNVTVLVGAESGGRNLVNASRAATQASTLDTVMLSLLFGQGRSDYATFVGAGVPTAFFTDATPPCYHTVDDEASIVDYAKLQEQIVTAEALTRDLMNTDSVPTYDAHPTGATYDDAVSIHRLLLQAQPDFPRFSDEDDEVANQFVAALGTIVDEGTDAFDGADVTALLNGTAKIVNAWASGECDGFLAPP